MTDRIGQWAHRPETRSHLVESQIEDRVVMRCGKVMRIQLGDWEDTRLVFENPSWGYPACSQCAGGKSPAALLNEEPTLNTRGPNS